MKYKYNENIDFFLNFLDLKIFFVFGFQIIGNNEDHSDTMFVDVDSLCPINHHLQGNKLG